MVSSSCLGASSFLLLLGKGSQDCLHVGLHRVELVLLRIKLPFHLTLKRLNILVDLLLDHLVLLFDAVALLSSDGLDLLVRPCEKFLHEVEGRVRLALPIVRRALASIFLVATIRHDDVKEHFGVVILFLASNFALHVS